MRILVIRRGAIGDIIVTLPTLEILRENYPDAYIEVIGNYKYWEIAHNRYYVNTVSSGETRFLYEIYLRNREFSKETVNYFSSFDLVLAYISDPEGIVRENLIKIGVKRVIIYPPFPRGENQHAADYTALILREIELNVNPPLFPKIHLSREDLNFASRFLFPFREYQPLVAIHPRTFGHKGWAIEKFIEIGRWIENTLNGKSMWIIGPAEEENIKAIESNFPSSPILKFQSLPEVAAVLGSCHLYFGCDTGISHLAAAAGTRVLALFGPTNPRVWCPRGKNVLIVKSDEMPKIQEDKVEEIITKYITSNDIEGIRCLQSEDLNDQLTTP
mgnify:CR=1 FL=1